MYTGPEIPLRKKPRKRSREPNPEPNIKERNTSYKPIDVITNITVLLWNVRSIRSTWKRDVIFNEIKKLAHERISINSLVETKLTGKYFEVEQSDIRQASTQKQGVGFGSLMPHQNLFGPLAIPFCRSLQTQLIHKYIL